MICKSCSTAKTTSRDNEASVELCTGCCYLLGNLALRPDMWQRLARLIGPNHYILHDDFYDDDGFPCASEIEFDQTEYHQYRFHRGEPYESAEKYLDDLLTRYLLFEEDIKLPDSINIADIERALVTEIDSTDIEEFRYKCYQVLGALPKSSSIATFLTNRWRRDKYEYWGAIARCVIKNIDPEASRSMLMEALRYEKWDYPKDSLHVLSDYADDLAIDMLTDIVKERKIPLMYDLGAIVRSCNPSFERLRRMIRQGRPESLMAIDALWIEDSPQYTRYFKYRLLRTIEVDKAELKHELEQYRLADSAPRVLTAINSVFKRVGLE